MKRATRPAGLIVATALLTAAPIAAVAAVTAPAVAVTASTATTSPCGNLSWD